MSSLLVNPISKKYIYAIKDAILLLFCPSPQSKMTGYQGQIFGYLEQNQSWTKLGKIATCPGRPTFFQLFPCLKETIEPFVASKYLVFLTFGWKIQLWKAPNNTILCTSSFETGSWYLQTGWGSGNARKINYQLKYINIFGGFRSWDHTEYLITWYNTVWYLFVYS